MDNFGWGEPGVYGGGILRGAPTPRIDALAAGSAPSPPGVTGTDALNPNVFYGHGLHTELWHFTRAGIAPIEVLRRATLEAATAVGAEEHLGTLEPGKLADVVLLDENPLGDIRHAMAIWRVLLGGRVFASEPELTAW